MPEVVNAATALNDGTNVVPYVKLRSSISMCPRDMG